MFLTRLILKGYLISEPYEAMSTHFLVSFQDKTPELRALALPRHYFFGMGLPYPMPTLWFWSTGILEHRIMFLNLVAVETCS
jgi:hypothetical protein